MTTTTASERPLKTAETWREERTEVLRLALARGGLNDPHPWRVVADELWDWVCGGAPTPTPPAADDLAAARAEIERLRAALTIIACFNDKAASEKLERSGDYAGFDEPWSVALARAALLPTPPDAKPAPERERLKGWVNVYKAGFSGAVHTEKGDADELAAQRQQNDRLACIDLSQHFVGEGLEP